MYIVDSILTHRINPVPPSILRFIHRYFPETSEILPLTHSIQVNQERGAGCGVFVLEWIRALLDGRHLNTVSTQQERQYRWQLSLESLHQQILPPIHPHSPATGGNHNMCLYDLKKLIL
jgi:hypothetical protein